MAVLITDLEGLSTVTGIHGGQGETRWKAVGGTSMMEGDWDAIEFARLAGGASAGVHTHMLTEELWFALSGCDEATLGHDKTVLEPGDLVLTGIGGSHGSKQIGDTPFDMLVIAVRRNGPRVANGGVGAASDRYHRVNLDQEAQDDTAILGVNGSARVSAVRTDDLRRVMGGQWRTLAAVDLQAGGTLGPRKLGASEMFLFVRAGEGVAVIDGKDIPLPVSTSVTFSRSSTVEVRTRGDAPLRLFVAELGVFG